MMGESYVQSNNRIPNSGLEAVEIDTEDDIEDFDCGETQHSITGHTDVTEARSNKFTSYSVSQFFDNLQNNSYGRTTPISQQYLNIKGKKTQLSVKGRRFPLGNRDVDSEDFSETFTSGTSSDDESKCQVHLSVFPEISRKTMSDQVHEILTASGVRNGVLAFSVGKTPSLYESLQQVIQPEREIEVDICRNLQQDKLPGRDAPPLHFTFKIQAFSQLTNDPVIVEKLVSDKFEAGDYNWKLSIYPNGDKSRGGASHVSIFLSLVDTSSLPIGWQVNVIFNIFVFDHISDKYFYLKDGRVRRFHAMKMEWGYSKFMDLATFQQPSNGFLLEDGCVFGAEVFVLKQARKAEFLSMVKEPISANYVWKLKNFSTLTSERYESDLFFSGDYRWKIRIYPEGNGDGKGNSLSLFMCADEATLSSDTRLFVRYTLRLVDQNNSKHSELKADYVFGMSNPVWGSQKFVTLAKFRDPRKGLLVDNGCVIEAELILLGLLNIL